MTAPTLSAVRSIDFEQNTAPAHNHQAQTATVFDDFTPALQPATLLRAAITAAYRKPEPAALADLLPQATPPAAIAQAGDALALELAKKLRERKADAGRAGLVQGLLQEFALSSQEGIALMCLAEALLRIPDAATRDVLIRDKIAHGEWKAHVGKSPSMFVNAAAWGLVLTGKLVATHSEGSLGQSLTRLIGRGGEPLIRKGVDMAMRMMGEQFVTGETIGEALQNAERLEAKGFRYSYDMLGEAAMTADDAKRYLRDYENAIHAIGKASNGRGVYEGPGISIKLSALHPRYSRAQHDRVMAELYPVVLQLTLLARQYNIGLNIDAEEADRLELSLDLLEKLCFAPELAGFAGIGFVVQAYQKRCPYVLDFIIDLARRSQHRLMVRLVKGAYWDSEIKRAQVEGLEGYPVYTRKAYTDVSYIANARKLLAAPDAVYPQFATHNAHTLATIYHLADPATYQPGQYEFQCLHGMGEPLYEQVVGRNAAENLGRPCRIYAPVGTHETLLAYLVRRLLENGANTSFVNRIADQDIPLSKLVENPVATVQQWAQSEGQLGLPNPHIAQPRELYGDSRANSAGLDLANDDRLRQLQGDLQASAAMAWHAEPMLAQGAPATTNAPEAVVNPADHRDTVGQVTNASAEQVEFALGAAQAAAARWQATPVAERADCLERAGDLLEAHMPTLMGVLVREAGKTCSNAIAEVREAVDFLRFYAAQVRSWSNAVDPSGYQALGPVVCISPWNFPLAIFTGQVAAALAAGNTVLAKPAEQTPLIAAAAVQALWQAGVPSDVLQLLPGTGETVGARLTADSRVQGVMFTGSTEVARILQKTLAQRLDAHGQPVTLVAETGGQNAMIVDSSALAEQVVVDVLSSAFDSAGQRCSALRVLCVQEEAADRLFAMLRGAMQELNVGNPAQLHTDVGPVIDAEAQGIIDRHIARMKANGHQVWQTVARPGSAAQGTAQGTFVPPTVIAINKLSELQREVFGPVLHILRYKRENLAQLVADINATGYALTLGLHTRIDETIAQVVNAANAGNIYVNRNIVGAVVGVQPFGGEGLSGTGPKAGGPLYMLRLLARMPATATADALAHLPRMKGSEARAAAATPVAGKRGNAHGLELADAAPAPALAALQAWAQQQGQTQLASLCLAYGAHTGNGFAAELPGPTGERNLYVLGGRERIACVAGSADKLLAQLAAVLAVGTTAVWPQTSANAALLGQLPADVRAHVVLAGHNTEELLQSEDFDALLTDAASDWLATGSRLTARPGAIIPITAQAVDGSVPLFRLLAEHAISINTAAAGGNASLMTLG
ncbi:trifunctional transcriptional regulator/proline dehydrogenase/L-glutamate gamma-semialdehyde dehydrogenase [Comamonas odontotermitis]|uniref:trifunctional transcriptional regulator/proline dehydrogenase/L-glutamate gamma-semialdehyde dehydrogenase n=1 Tax=Comamonas odontotermitis TaxID=379895 RepID=UPI001CC6389A|nr:trifunctional transcriptional regulator/proline dehydrogenase/L-glutamate gamma-semialdehyde dehydrogenase [Comamonas odontotermitis]UBB17056.1 trifunctional transcriptional regulator/proline dehydrogenase/L-glutamate gamma-semialdehyde dehydrogenase [Comamonas odontotermitis]